jgi:hypothetical protein
MLSSFFNILETHGGGLAYFLGSQEENAHVQHAAIRGLQVYGGNEDFTRQYRRQV